MSITIPSPQTLLQITWAIIGFMLARSFKKLDHTIKQTTKYDTMDPISQFLIGGTLDFFHHFWIGMLLMVYCNSSPEVYWFGYGLFIDDLPDIPTRFRKYFEYLTA